MSNDTIICQKCKKKNLQDANFCCRCGINLIKSLKKCSICLEEKKLEILICGHLTCRQCIDACYKIKKECPQCRKELICCSKCSSYRVLKENDVEKCLDCLHEVKVNEYKITNVRKTCLECSSKRLLYNHISNSWKCLDCFSSFEIINGQSRLSRNTVSTTIICTKCCSNDIGYLEGEMGTSFCRNCLNKDIETKSVSMEEYSLLRIK